MLTAPEARVVLTTLTKRRAWLLKTLEDRSLESSQRKELTGVLELLDSAMKKIAAGSQQVKPAQAPTSPAPEIQAQRKNLTIETARALIAEDSPESAELLLSLLQDIGLKQVEIAKDGREAFDMIKSSEYGFDIILCDWDMPELTGLEVYQKAKASKTLRDAHFCMVTGITEAKRIREAIQSGVNDYIVKPVDGVILEEKIRATIAAKAAASTSP